MRFQGDKFFYYFAKTFPYLRVTVGYTLIALGLGLIFGFILALMKLGRSRALCGLSNVVTAVFRSIPSVVLLFLVYYGLPFLSKMVLGIDISRKSSFFFVTIAITISSSVQITEVIRSAYTSVDKGQMEAAVSIGMTRFQGFRRIVLPQLVSYALPSMSTIVINLTKEGSLGYTIGLLDIFGKAISLNALTYSNYILEIYFSLTVLYWILMLLIVYGFRLLEHTFRIQKLAVE